MTAWVSGWLNSCCSVWQKTAGGGGNAGLVLGLSFKENCPDLRNKVVDLIRGLERYGMEVDVVDPWVDPKEALKEFGLKVMAAIPADRRYGAVAAAVAHRQFASFSVEEWKQLLMPAGVLLDLKGIVPRQLDPLRL